MRELWPPHPCVILDDSYHQGQRLSKSLDSSLSILCKGIWWAVSRALRTQAPDVWVQSGEADVQGKAISQEVHAASRGFSDEWVLSPTNVSAQAHVP